MSTVEPQPPWRGLLDIPAEKRMMLECSRTVPCLDFDNAGSPWAVGDGPATWTFSSVVPPVSLVTITRPPEEQHRQAFTKLLEGCGLKPEVGWAQASAAYEGQRIAVEVGNSPWWSGEALAAAVVGLGGAATSARVEVAFRGTKLEYLTDPAGVTMVQFSVGPRAKLEKPVPCEVFKSGGVWATSSDDPLPYHVPGVPVWIDEPIAEMQRVTIVLEFEGAKPFAARLHGWRLREFM